MVDIPAATYELNHAELKSSPARMFYSYHPATVSADTAPLFVLSGGGPGAAMLFLLGFTGPYAIANSETTPSVAVNADSLTDLAHLLYVDARNAGLSWTELPEPSNELLRRAEFAVQNYNVFVDAADVLSVVLAFLEEHPNLARRDVYFVTESYGGARTSVMLNFLLDHVEYAKNGRAFHSPDLDQRIDRYMKEQLGNQPSQEDVAHRFVGQILLEPILAGARQNDAAGTLFEKPGSIIDQLALAAGVPYVRCSTQIPACNPFDNAQTFLQRINRSRYDSRSDASWLDAVPGIGSPNRKRSCCAFYHRERRRVHAGCGAGPQGRARLSLRQSSLWSIRRSWLERDDVGRARAMGRLFHAPQRRGLGGFLLPAYAQCRGRSEGRSLR